MMQEFDAKDEAKKEGLMELIKKMYELMDQEKEGGMSEDDSEEEEKPMLGMMEDKKESSLLSKATDKSEGEDSSGLDMEEVKDFLTKKRKAPVGKSINFMAITKSAAPKMDIKKAMKKFA